MSHDVGNVVVNSRQPVNSENHVQKWHGSIPRSQRVQDIETLVEGILELLILLQQKRASLKSVKNLTELVLTESKKVQDTYGTKATMLHMIASVAINVLGAGIAFKGGTREIVEGFSMASKGEETLWSNIFQMSYESARKGAETHQGLYNTERNDQQQVVHQNLQQHDELERKLSEFYAKLTQLAREMR